LIRRRTFIGRHIVSQSRGIVSKILWGNLIRNVHTFSLAVGLPAPKREAETENKKYREKQQQKPKTNISARD
jgi:hypothetical protein